jgi:nickel-type superoxide dismutase maturation protease
MRWPYGRVAVVGASMRPQFEPADWLVVRWGARIRTGDVVVARRPDRPSLLIVKRAVARVDCGWVLRGDNPLASDDSRIFGPVADHQVLGRVLFRYWPLRRPVRA